MASTEIENAPVATIWSLDTKNEVAITIDLTIDRGFLTSFARDLFGDDASPESERAVLLECANIVMGAVKNSF